MKSRWTSVEAIEVSSAHIKRAGFEFVNASMKSVACYYRFPGRFGFLRLSDHARRYCAAIIGSEPVIASISFCIPPSPSDGKFEMSVEQIETRVAQAIGMYMMKAMMPSERIPLPSPTRKAKNERCSQT